MGINCDFERISAQQSEEFLANPRLAYEYVFTGLRGIFDNSADEDLERDLLKQQEKRAAENRRFSLRKDWHVLHYALNGTTKGGNGPLGVCRE